MPEDPVVRLRELLRRVGAGEAGPRELADALAGVEALVGVIAGADFAGYAGELDAALAEKGLGNVTVDDAGEPPVAGEEGEGGTFVPRLFTDQELARAHGEATGLIGASEAVMMNERSPASWLGRCLEEGWRGVLLDAGTDHELRLGREEVARLHALLTGAGTVAGPSREAPGGPDPRALAREGAALPPVPPPGRPDPESEAFFEEFRGRVEGGSVGIREYLDVLGFDLDLHVPVDPEPADGLRWPGVFRHPADEGKTATFVFTSEEVARRVLSGGDREAPRLLHLSGIEALRWCWASPRCPDEIAVNAYPGTEGWLSFPAFWAASLVYPHFVDVEDLGEVETVPLPRLGADPRARALDPGVVRALVTGWESLVGVVGVGSGGPDVVTHGPGRYIPAFTGPDPFFAFESSRRDFRGTPAPTRDAPPFGGWLRAAAVCDGVVLDPDGEAPLVLDHTDLLVLDLWCRSPDRQPGGREIALEVGRLLAEEAISPHLAGRILADWPRWFVGLARGSGGRTMALTLPGRDACPVFTGEERARLYVRAYREAGLSGGEGMEPVPVLNRWLMSAFRHVADNFEEGGWIDPSPEEAGTLLMAREMAGEGSGAFDPGMMEASGPELDEEVLDGALERIGERLRPRVPGFVADGGGG